MTSCYMNDVDKVMSAGRDTPYKYRTLRTIFDEASSDWNETTLHEKAVILKELVAGGLTLYALTKEYRLYWEDNGRTDISNAVEDALIAIVEAMVVKI